MGDAGGVQQRTGNLSSSKSRQHRFQQARIFDIVQNQQGISMPCKITTEVTSTPHLIFGMGYIIVRRQIVSVFGEFSELPQPVSVGVSGPKHPEDTCWESILVAIGEFDCELGFADTAHASDANQANASKPLGRVREQE